MNTIENVKPGQHFTCMGVEYLYLRNAGMCTQPNRNQWGRSEGGTYQAHRIAVKVNKGHKGWWFSYTAFRPGMMVIVKD